jgi:hypothetical protein
VDDLTIEESRLLELLLYMTGREDRLSRKPLVQKEQISGIRAIWPHLRDAAKRAMEPGTRCELMNRLLLGLGVNPISIDFFNTVFDLIDFSNFEEVRKRIDLFRALCMLDYGNFRYGYKQFRQGTAISERWHKHFPAPEEVTQRARDLRNRLETVGLIPIAPSQLFSLGYLAGEHAPRINEARKSLVVLLNRAREARVSNFDELRSIAKKSGVESLMDLLAKAGIPGTEGLLYSDMPLFGGSKKTYSEILLELEQSCVTVDEAAIKEARENGLHNARTYLAVQDLDVYVATSMREPLNFTTNWEFVRRLFHQGELAEWRLRYFDPTQAFLEDRIQKGLLECLMIKRTRLTVYNAQETDTFGKDAEAGVTLAQRKPVIVYVARLFEHLPALQSLYKAIDDGARVERDAFVETLIKQGVIEAKERDNFLGPEKTKADVVRGVIEKHGQSALRELGEDKIAVELIRQGYDPEQAGADLVPFTLRKIQMLERRALTFRDIHPLSLQTSPIDGVSRGVIVTRSVGTTAEVAKGIFLGTLRFEIIDDKLNWLLLDELTKSPIRVVTKDPILTTAFWSEHWGSTED